MSETGVAGPGRRLSSSSGLGWRLAGAERHRDPVQLPEFAAGASTDLLLVLVTAGRYTIESRQGSARYAPGSVAVTAPGVPSVFRWRSAGQRVLESLHVRFPGARVRRTLEDFGGRPGDVAGLDALSLDDAYASASLTALGRALDDRAPGLYADAVAQAVLVHLVGRAVPDPVRRNRISRDPGALGDRELTRVVEYMRARIGEDVGLEELAGLVNISKYHFLRMFTAATGTTPHRYLVELRLRHAAGLLRGGALSVQQIAMVCGYQSPSRFAASFRRRYGLTPSEYRR